MLSYAPTGGTEGSDRVYAANVKNCFALLYLGFLRAGFRVGMSGAMLLLCSSIAPRRVLFRGGVFFLLRRGGEAEYEASWLNLGPSVELTIGCASSSLGGVVDGLVSSVEPEPLSELDGEELLFSSLCEVLASLVSALSSEAVMMSVSLDFNVAFSRK